MEWPSHSYSLSCSSTRKDVRLVTGRSRFNFWQSPRSFTSSLHRKLRTGLRVPGPFCTSKNFFELGDSREIVKLSSFWLGPHIPSYHLPLAPSPTPFLRGTRKGLQGGLKRHGEGTSKPSMHFFFLVKATTYLKDHCFPCLWLDSLPLYSKSREKAWVGDSPGISGYR